MNTIWQSIITLPHKLKLAFSNKHRLRNIAERVIETVFGITVFVMTGSILLVVLAEFCFFEFFAEPIGFSGYYWERGPREGESPDNDGYWEE